jgi:hypothetical protein
VDASVEQGTVHRFPEWLVTVVTEPNHGPCPARRIIWVAWQIAPHDGAALLGKLPRKRVVDPDKPVLNKLL